MSLIDQVQRNILKERLLCTEQLRRSLNNIPETPDVWLAHIIVHSSGVNGDMEDHIKVPPGVVGYCKCDGVPNISLDSEIPRNKISEILGKRIEQLTGSDSNLFLI